jgi:hypothetical protein
LREPASEQRASFRTGSLWPDLNFRRLNVCYPASRDGIAILAFWEDIAMKASSLFVTNFSVECAAAVRVERHSIVANRNLDFAPQRDNRSPEARGRAQKAEAASC